MYMCKWVCEDMCACAFSARLLAFQFCLFSLSKLLKMNHRNPAEGEHSVFDFCELFLCCSSSHTLIARLRSTFGILYMENSLDHTFNLVIGVHLCCIHGQAVATTASSSHSDADWRDGWNGSFHVVNASRQKKLKVQRRCSLFDM